MKYVQVLVLLCLCFFVTIVHAQEETAVSDSAAANAHLQKDTAAMFTIGGIVINGNKRTKDYIIQREIPFKTGQSFSAAELTRQLERARNQVYNTTLFIDVTVYAANIIHRTVYINVDVKERWYLFPIPYFTIVDRNFNQWWVENKRSLDRVNYGIKFMYNNFSGRNDDLNVWLINGYSQQLSFRYRQPFSDKSLKRGFDVGIGYSRGREINYINKENKQEFFKDDSRFIKSAFRADVTYSYRPDSRYRQYFRVAYHNDWIADTIRKLNPNYFYGPSNRVSYMEANYNFQYYNLDYNYYPTKGVFYEFWGYKKGFSKYMNLWGLGVKALYVHRLNEDKTFLHLQAAAQLQFPFDQPYYNQQFFGYGDFYLRGTEYFIIDGVAGGMLKTTLHQKLFKFIFKNPFKIKNHERIPFSFYINTFTDLGYAYNKNPGTSVFNNKVVQTWGVGLDIISIYDIVIRLQYSINTKSGGDFYFHSRND